MLFAQSFFDMITTAMEFAITAGIESG